MRILIIGGGEVGTSIAADLSDAHEVVVVDIDSDRVDRISQALNVLAIQGDGTALETLQNANIDEVDIAIATTDDDEVNLAACGTVSSISDTFTISQVEKTTYLRTWERSHGAFGTNFMVNSDLRAAQSISRIVNVPMAHDLEVFAGGAVQVAEFEITDESPVVGTSSDELVEADDLAAVAVLRDTVVVAPDGATDLEPGDHVIVVGRPDAVDGFAERITATEDNESIDDVVVLGDGSVAHHVARLLEETEQRPTPRLMAEDPDRAREIADDIPATTILVHDVTDPDFLARENIGDADVAIVALDSDQRSLLVSMLARRLGVSQTVTVVDTAEYDDLFEAAGVDVAVHPRAEAAEEISRFTRGRRAENVAIIEPDVAEVFEIEVEEGSLLVDHTVNEVEESLPEGVVTGAITREGEYLAPRPSTTFKQGDHVVMFAEADVSDEALRQV